MFDETKKKKAKQIEDYDFFLYTLLGTTALLQQG